jgi:hypothetical protein
LWSSVVVGTLASVYIPENEPVNIASSQDMFPAVDSIQNMRSDWFSPPPQRDFVYANTSQIDHLWRNQKPPPPQRDFVCANTSQIDHLWKNQWTSTHPSEN